MSEQAHRIGKENCSEIAFPIIVTGSPKRPMYARILVSNVTMPQINWGCAETVQLVMVDGNADNLTR